MSLVIVESAAKAKTIQGYLNAAGELRDLGPFRVMACCGHVLDLPAKGLGVDTAEWTAVYAPKNAKLLATLRKAAKAATRVWLASDPDREGECIAQHLATALKLARPARIVFHEITPAALVHAVLHPVAIDAHLVQAQEARRLLDRAVGYSLSPLLWRQLPDAPKGLSAGRVQSAALRLVVDRAAAAAAHQPRPYWRITGAFEGGLAATAPTSWACEAAARQALAELAAVGDWGARTTRREVAKAPPPPFATASLQQAAYRQLGFGARQTMQLAQALYEAGGITYMRTDSLRLSAAAQAELAAHIEATHGAAAVEARCFRARAAHAQEAHEAIRATRPDAAAPPGLSAAHDRLYDLIRRRAIASQMAATRYLETTTTIASPTYPHLAFTATQQTPVQAGYLRADGPRPLQALSFTAVGHATQPPPAYDEATLVKALETHGIGRPSTYASTIDKLYEKGYVTNAGAANAGGPTLDVPSYRMEDGALVKEVSAARCDKASVARATASDTGPRDALAPTPLGCRVMACLSAAAPAVVDAAFTSAVEADLDGIAHGSKNKKDVLTAFYGPFIAGIATFADAVPQRAATAVAPASRPWRGAKGRRRTSVKRAGRGEAGRSQL